MDANFRSVVLFVVIHILISNCKNVLGLYYKCAFTFQREKCKILILCTKM